MLLSADFVCPISGVNELYATLMLRQQCDWMSLHFECTTPGMPYRASIYVCLSVTRRYCVKTNEYDDAVFTVR